MSTVGGRICNGAQPCASSDRSGSGGVAVGSPGSVAVVVTQLLIATVFGSVSTSAPVDRTVSRRSVSDVDRRCGAPSGLALPSVDSKTICTPTAFAATSGGIVNAVAGLVIVSTSVHGPAGHGPGAAHTLSVAASASAGQAVIVTAVRSR